LLPIPPDMLGMLTTLYGVGAAGAALLQARQVVRRGSSCEVSARFFATYAGGYAVWLLYGLSIDSLPLILVDAAGLACGLVTLAITLRMRGSLLRPRTWGSCPENSPNAIDGRQGDRARELAPRRRPQRSGALPVNGRRAPFPPDRHNRSRTEGDTNHDIRHERLDR
jgi:uncharacterized protein with PQ loop repeat